MVNTPIPLRLLFLFLAISWICSVVSAGKLTEGNTKDSSTRSNKDEENTIPFARTFELHERASPSRIDCGVSCPIPSHYMENHGQICVTLLAKWAGHDYCLYSIAVSLLDYTRHLEPNNEPVIKYLDSVVSRAAWYHRILYNVEHFFVALMILALLGFLGYLFYRGLRQLLCPSVSIKKKLT